jgi:hypothetical protein
LLGFQRSVVKEVAGAHHLRGLARPLPVALRGVDSARLALLSRLTHAKRLGKIARLMPATFALLGGELRDLAPDFAAAHPPRSAKSLANARQFHRFLRARRKRGGLSRADVLDVAACEIAVATVSQQAGRPRRAPAAFPRSRALRMRRAPGCVFLVLARDVRPLLSFRAGNGCGTNLLPAAPTHPVHLVVVPNPSGYAPRLLQLEPALFEWLRASRRWRVVQSFPLPRGRGRAFLSRLASLGLLQIGSPDLRSADTAGERAPGSVRPSRRGRISSGCGGGDLPKNLRLGFQAG